MALMRQSVLIDILCLARSGNTEAAGCLLLLSAEKPDLESEKHIMNQTDCVEIGKYCLICSFVKKYIEDNFHLNNFKQVISGLFFTNEISNSTLIHLFTKHPLASASSLKPTIFCLF